MHTPPAPSSSSIDKTEFVYSKDVCLFKRCLFTSWTRCVRQETLACNARKWVHTTLCLSGRVRRIPVASSTSTCRCSKRSLYAGMSENLDDDVFLGRSHFCRSKSVSEFPVGPYRHHSDGILKSTEYLPKKLPCPPIFSWNGRREIIVTLP